MNSFFGDDFYPTPPELIARMLHGVNINNDDAILEPSAGKGDLVKAIISVKNGSWDEANDIDAIEIDPNLRHILEGKEIRVVHSDFLTFDTLKRYDLIVMNPPFSRGAEHLDKALHLLKPGGTCVCLLNAETVNNQCTSVRKALYQRLKSWNASITPISGAFKFAERQTGVNIVLIKVTCPVPTERVSILLDGLKQTESQETKQTFREKPNALVDSDFIRAVVARCRLEQRAGLKLIEEYEAMKPYILEFIPPNKENNPYAIEAKPIIKIDIKPNQYIRCIREKYWKALFENEEFVGQLTSDLQKELHNQIERLKDYDFNLENIIALRDELGRKFLNGVNDTILALFEEFTTKHSWLDETSQNVHYFNGWKTNKAKYVNKKVIIPLNAFWRLNIAPSSFSYEAVRKITDVEKVLAFLDGDSFSWKETADLLRAAEQRRETKNIQLKNISITFYKKGTAHIVFTNLDILRKFNIYCCQKNNWLPPDYGITPYEDLSPEARCVVDSFSPEGDKIPKGTFSSIGEKSYRQVCTRKDLLVIGESSLPRIGFSKT